MKNSKLILLIILGIIFWFNGAISVKLLGNYVFTEDSPYKIEMFVLAFPMLFLAIFIAIKAVKLNHSEILTAVVVMNFAAVFLDGIALNFFRQIYHDVYEISHYGAAWILWGGGAGLLIAYLMTQNNITLGRKKVILSVILGAIFWFVGAMIIRFFGDSVFSENNNYRILALVLLFPLSYVFILITQKIVNLQKSELLNSVSIVTLTAMFLDGIALTWFRGLYSDKYEVSHYGAGFILFGVGAGLLLSYLMNDNEKMLEN
ncbi:MAG: DUF5367 family protein [Pyrinomonadaceae bacterium]|nr:DUF5367 family protein [Pyrinomonadaceae bacterium]